MRAVICFNPRVPLEHAIKGREYAEVTLGFDFFANVQDHAALARELRALADVLEAPTVPDPDFI